MAGKIWVIFLREVEIFLHIWINNKKRKLFTIVKESYLWNNSTFVEKYDKCHEPHLTRHPHTLSSHALHVHVSTYYIDIWSLVIRHWKSWLLIIIVIYYIDSLNSWYFHHNYIGDTFYWIRQYYWPSFQKKWKKINEIKNLFIEMIWNLDEYLTFCFFSRHGIYV